MKSSGIMVELQYFLLKTIPHLLSKEISMTDLKQKFKTRQVLLNQHKSELFISIITQAVVRLLWPCIFSGN